MCFHRWLQKLWKSLFWLRSNENIFLFKLNAILIVTTSVLQQIKPILVLKTGLLISAGGGLLSGFSSDELRMIMWIINNIHRVTDMLNDKTCRLQIFVLAGKWVKYLKVRRITFSQTTTYFIWIHMNSDKSQLWHS